jgi:precorrin-6A/cobalt-precorrin-6A reductase
MANILIFAGTTEGRTLAQTLASHGINCHVCVATEYGKELMPQDNMTVTASRLSEEQMTDLLQSDLPDCVVDATHPYAQEVTKNIRAACEKAGVPYFRLLREQTVPSDCILCETIETAVEYLSKTEGNILVTTGSKELSQYRSLSGAAERIYARVLPTAEGIESCHTLGLSGSHIIAMQGPFSEDLNRAMLRQIKAKYLVMKDSGVTGGADQKILAAQKEGVSVLLIGRPSRETGFSYSALEQYLIDHYGLRSSQNAGHGYFPMFVDLYQKRVVVIGGGTIALRRVKTLFRFGCLVTVISPSAVPELLEMVNQKEINWECREYQTGDCDKAALVCAATNSRTVNHRVYEECKQKTIPLSVADCKEECSFYFPAVVIKDGMIFGITSGGVDHRAVRETADWLRKLER